jgi:aldehyde dehydrogenase (NAD+)
MTTDTSRVPLARPDRFFIGGEWVAPATDCTIDVIEAATEQLYFRVAEARAPDIDRAIATARQAFDDGPWPRMTHTERAAFLRAMAQELRRRIEDASQIWPRESGVVHTVAEAALAGVPEIYTYYAELADSYPFEEPVASTANGARGLFVKEPVGVVGAIVPWNAPMLLIALKLAPALLAGCTVVLKASPEAPGAAYIMAEVAAATALPPGVLNVVTAERDVSELVVRDPRVDKISFTGSTAAGRRIASLCGERIARCSLELGGKSAAVILDDADLGAAATTLAGAECFLTGQVCNSLTRIVVPRQRHDELVDALAAFFAQVKVGDPFEAGTQMGPLAMRRQRDRVEELIAKGVADGARLAIGGGRPKGLDRGWFIEPTVFANVDNSSTIAREEIFGPVLSVIPAGDEDEAVRIANDTIYGLNAAVFTADVDRARSVAARLRSGTVLHNAKSVAGAPLGGFKQSGIGREGGTEGLLTYLETKFVTLIGVPERCPDETTAS